MLRSSHDACGCSTQTTSTINLKRSTLHPHEGQADRPNTPSDSVTPGSNPGPPATDLPDMTLYFKFPQSPEKSLYFRALAPFSPAVKRAEGPRIDEVACRAEFSRSHGPMPRR